ncbi:MAG: GMC family oxidoreductase [Pseudomonadota bacterium]
MPIDGRTIPTDTSIECDLCIVGAGVAGITIAREFADQEAQVILLESGGLEYDEATQELYDGEVAGNPIAELEIARLRYFGGSSNHWHGYSRPFDPIDFEKRTWIPHSGWPFGYDELAPFYGRAHDLLQIGEYDYRPESFSESLSPMLRSPLLQDRLQTAMFKVNPLRLGEQYLSDVTDSGSAQLYLWSNLQDIETDQQAREITGLRVATLAGNHFWIRPRQTVLATGGIENARLLLNANTVRAAGLGNEHDMVGRCFMDHPSYEAATIMLDRSYDFARPGFSEGTDAMIALSPEVQRSEQIANFLCQTWPVRAERYHAESYRHLREIVRNVLQGRIVDDFNAKLWEVVSDLDGVGRGLSSYFFEDVEMLEVRIHPEVVPNPDSRITLTEERDALGMQRVKVDWRLTDVDRRSIRRGLEILGEEIGREGIGRLKFADWVLEDGFEVPGVGSYHHIGTTRMGGDARNSVIDPDCRIHGMDNLYVAGSSVFPTSSSANPTLTIAALALRLADHLKARLSA